jgi:hypothetical protein
MISVSTNGQETTEGRSVRDIVEHEHGQVNDAWCRKLVRQLLQSLERQYAMDMPHRAITADTVVFHQNGEPLLLPSIVSDPAPAEADDLTALAKLIHYAITQELMPEGPLHGRGLDGYSEALLTAVDRCMDPDPARRPQSIAALRAILGIVAPGSSPLPPPPALAEMADPVPAPVPALEPEPAPEPAPDQVPHQAPHQAPPVPAAPAAPLTASMIPAAQPPAPAPAPAARAAQQPRSTVPTQALRASADSTPSPTAPPATPPVQPTSQPTSQPPDETAQSDTARRPRWAVPVGIAAAVLAVLLAAYARLHDSAPSADSMPAQTEPGSQTQADSPAPPPPAPAADSAGPALPDQPQQPTQVQDGSTLPAPMTAPTPQPATTTPAAPALAPSRTMPATANTTGNGAGNSTGNNAGNTVSPAGTAPTAANANPNAGATYRLQIQPWGTVYVDGIDRGVSPPVKRVQLSPGRHTVRVTNPNFHERVLDIDTANGDGRIVVDFGNAE